MSFMLKIVALDNHIYKSVFLGKTVQKAASEEQCVPADHRQ